MKYTVWITITIKHTFFYPERAGLQLRETEETRLFLRKSGVVFRRLAPGQWVLLRPEIAAGRVNRLDLLLKESGRILEFDLVPASADMYYFTHWEKAQAEGREWSLHVATEAGKSRRFLRIPLDASAAEDTRHMAITLHSREVRWEFILIPKYNDTTYPIELKESRERLSFSTPEPISFPGEKKAYRSVSSSLIAMKKSYAYTISLWEKRDNGKRLLSNFLPFPRVTSASVTGAKDTITSYFYF